MSKLFELTVGFRCEELEVVTFRSSMIFKVKEFKLIDYRVVGVCGK